MTMQWGGEEWQTYCGELFAVRHGEHYQPVPDTVRGDWGIEGFNSEGTLYQCYAPEEPLTSKDLHEKLRDKVTADLSKLRTNLTTIRSLVDPSPIRCWVLVVPRVEDKEILVHCQNKAAQIRNDVLDGVDEGFVIRVVTDDHFAAERNALGATSVIQFPEGGSPTEDEVETFAADVDLDALDAKLQKLNSGTGDIQRLRGEILRHFLSGEQLDEWLRRYHGTLWERWNHDREALRRTLTTTQLTSGHAPAVRMETVRNELREFAIRDIPALQGGDVLTLTWGAIATWLVDCPLDFEVADV